MTSDSVRSPYRGLTPALPFCHFTIKAERLKSPAYPTGLITLGDHLLAKRLDLGLTQKEVAQKLGIDEATVHNWEREHFVTAVRFIPRIIEFLGYDPPQPEILFRKG